MDNIEVTLTGRQIEVYTLAYEHHAVTGDDEFRDLFHLVNGAKRSQTGYRISLTPGQACDLMSLIETIADSSQEAGELRAATNAIKRLRDAGAETIREYNARLRAEKETREDDAVAEAPTSNAQTQAETSPEETVTITLTGLQTASYLASWEHHSASHDPEGSDLMRIIGGTTGGNHRPELTLTRRQAENIMNNYATAAESIRPYTGYDKESRKTANACAAAARSIRRSLNEKTVRADSVAPGDTVTGVVCTGGVKIRHASPYKAQPHPYDPAACTGQTDDEGSLLCLAWDTPWDMCDTLGADTMVLVVPAGTR